MSLRLLAPEGRGRARIFVRAPRHLEDLLAAELESFGAGKMQVRTGGVQLEADLTLAYRICYRSRLASRVLWPLAAFPARDSDQLHAGVATLPWPDLMTPGATLAVGFDGTSRELRHTGFARQRVKDAVVDVLRDAWGARPDIDPVHPDMRLQAVLHRDRVTLYLDLAGEALHRRGWRHDGGEAPLKENLAAGLLLRGGWQSGAEGWLVDPVCGSGTLLIEGALIAADVPPGALRSRFGFESWSGHDPQRWAAITAEHSAAEGTRVRLFGRDQDPAQIERTRAHLDTAGAGHRFELELDLAPGRLEDLEELPGPIGLITGNPPYGQRLASDGALADLGRALRRRGAGAPVALLIAAAADTVDRDGAELLRELDLPRLERHPCKNGPLDAWMLTGSVEAGRSDGDDQMPPQALEHATMFANRVKKNAQHLARFARRVRTTAYRLYDRDLPEYALVVDRYGDALCVQEMAAPATVDPVLAERRREAALMLLPNAAGIDPAAVHFRVRRRQTPATQYNRQQSVGTAPTRAVVEEDGAHFAVNLSDYLDTGLYLDSRGVRRRIAALSREHPGTRFLNLYAYTGTATVHAALAGAAATISVDLSRTYLDWAGDNFSRNRLDDRHHRRVRADVLEWLEGPGREEVPFDLILLDPPTFSNSARTRNDLDLQRDHARLLDAALTLLAPAGRLLFLNHARKFRLTWTPPEGVRMEDITRATLDEDCARGRPAHRCWQLTRT
ncbi:MAG: bifunctional 23S rRNA (guanine(2069)-N(7))-methyltransferase RlmK/23S rRNA (guanine(2445)-N(2))-methyltransferase RlmL [Gammaproteobacteria bacterium]|nr:MAG: bifunctional 23S rRNA (guanine(2069)-N(7))-methyltransferase RlmK/23S rRNA (guanine(2445)-N(2))-methyltransferase RlmL [Gammaproteobacteria bacterium]